MKKYLSFFRIRFTNGLQYRAAAFAGISTQFVWGMMEILLYKAFYEADAASFPMKFDELTSYIWLQQAFLALFMTWFLENDIFASISSGDIAYELTRPIDLYDMWFMKSLANRLSKAVLRCFPILIIAAFLPKPYGIYLPYNLFTFLLFLVSTLLGLLVVVAFCMLVYITAFYTISPAGVRIIAVSTIEFFSGSVIPLPFLPDNIRSIFELLPFASMQNVPLRIYSGNINGNQLLFSIALQAFWTIALIVIGKLWMKKALTRVVVQGG